MGQPVAPTVNITAEMAMQRAVDILYSNNDPKTGLPKFEAVRAGGALVQLARELRLGKAKTRLYSSITAPADFSEEVVGVSWNNVPGATGYNIEIRNGATPRVEPIFGASEEVAAEV
jgi:hypothetical protein